MIADPAVSPHHAELLITDDGRLYLTDCATAGGTWRLSPTTAHDDEQWVAVRQAFVRAADRVRLGDYQCKVGDLVQTARRTEGGSAGGEAGEWDRAGARAHPVRGRVARDPVTGEIVRRRP